MQPTFTSATTTLDSGVIIPQAGLQVDSIFTGLFDNVDLFSFISWDAILNFLNNVWFIYTVLAYLVVIFLLVVYVYASVRFNQLLELREDTVKERERIYDERFRTGPKNNRLDDVLSHITSNNPNDWKLAIIEADIILDQALKSAGYNGVSLGERLRSINSTQLKNLDMAWQAHKVRNQIAHAGDDFVLTRRLAEDTVKQYRIVFNELGIK